MCKCMWSIDDELTLNLRVLLDSAAVGTIIVYWS